MSVGVQSLHPSISTALPHPLELEMCEQNVYIRVRETQVQILALSLNQTVTLGQATYPVCASISSSVS